MGLNEKEVVDNKLFWKTVVKPSPSSKVSGIIYIYTYGIHHRKILSSSYGKLS